MKTKFILSLFLMIVLCQKAVTGQEITSPESPNPPAPPVAPEAPSEPGKGTDTTRLKFGNVRMIIYEENDSMDVSVSNHEAQTHEDEDENDGRFNNWEGFYVGANGYLTYDNKLDLDTLYREFELDYSKSITLGWNFGGISFPIIKNYLAITSGFGFQWNRYAFKNNSDLLYDADTLIAVTNTVRSYSKNILRACYLQVPLLLEINTNADEDKAIHISAGVIGGYKLGSKIKQKYDIEDQTYKNKTKGHYHLSPFQAYLHAQLGFGNAAIFANYGLTRVFEKGKGPQLYPFTIGFKLLF